ncbi:MAG: DUF2183 domain-containing protein [Caldilineaceae bacterium]|nr:DUF2183 domain-containing protein [Caldilineaceae bacterium]MBP8109030.1 DUF2183 domain-containing protein [Caldilineaceae bacterium]MBP8124619.1 DUF2183 domain-containing protein [Caldilineaceae bacterium]MBP9073996.1 DUF2183 domain-containing protein [Caldilineaceae bacterium]
MALTEGQFDAMKNRLIDRMGWRDPLQIVAYRGYGTAQAVTVRGRVLEDPGLSPAADNDSVWTNLANMARRFASDEVPNAQVRVSGLGHSVVVVTDEEGYFEAILTPSAPPALTATPSVLHRIELNLLFPPSKNNTKIHAQGEVMIPGPGASFGVISDVDDTVLVTGATDAVGMARTVFTGNAASRMAFDGVAELYRALRGKQGNPIFYVSSSPWNLYDLLDDFLALNDLPAGPILLRDWGLSSTELLPTDHHQHKLGTINAILNTYPDLSFLLLGDSGQQDPEIYAQVVAEQPGQILGILIRDVGPGAARAAQVREMARSVTQSGVPMHLIADSAEAAGHALAAGWADSC